jgi:LysM repeat protein
MDEKARVWIARILAPIAFLAAATLLVVLVQRALENDDGATGAAGPETTVAVSTEVTETASTGEQEARKFYRIKTGDTLQAIAQRFDTTVDQLLELNPGIDPLALTLNQRIRVS